MASQLSLVLVRPLRRPVATGPPKQSPAVSAPIAVVAAARRPLQVLPGVPRLVTALATDFVLVL